MRYKNTYRPYLPFDAFCGYLSGLEAAARQERLLEMALDVDTPHDSPVQTIIKMLSEMFEPNYLGYRDLDGDGYSNEDVFYQIWDDWAGMCEDAICGYLYNTRDIVTGKYEHDSTYLRYWNTYGGGIEDEYVDLSTPEALWKILTGEVAIYEDI